ncbi:MAG: DUF420 domain-containing protein [Deltaproteobacteria bacterium]|nr:DUF420 domain-containing protein [Deltaproteobacteria bacterium]
MSLAQTVGDVLAPLNAILNATSATLVLFGFAAVRRKDTAAHSRAMMAAFFTSSLFLASYVTRWALTGTHRFPGDGWLKVAYLAILSSHMLLAIVTVPLVLRTISLGRRARYPEHRRTGRWTLPIWTYVSVTGVLVYVMLYHVA